MNTIGLRASNDKAALSDGDDKQNRESLESAPGQQDPNQTIEDPGQSRPESIMQVIRDPKMVTPARESTEKAAIMIMEDNAPERPAAAPKQGS